MLVTFQGSGSHRRWVASILGISTTASSVGGSEPQWVLGRYLQNEHLMERTVDTAGRRGEWHRKG